jgi:hypothetical protein
MASNGQNLHGYSNGDWAKDKENSHSMLGYCFMLVNIILL